MAFQRHDFQRVRFCVQTASMRILVVGATGMLGEPVARKLKDDGYDVRLLARDTGAARLMFGGDFEIVTGDVTDPASLLPAMQQCYGVHVNLRGANTLASYDKVERGGARNIASAAAHCGVRRLAYVSGAGIGDSETNDPLLAIKAAAVAAIVSSGIDYTIFKPTHFMESLPQFISGHRATVIGRQPHRYHYLAVTDFADLVSRSFRMAEAANKSLTIFGPEAFTMEEALRLYCAAAYPGMSVDHMPVAIARLLAAVTGNHDLRFAAMLFAGFSRLGERGDPTLAHRLFGAPRTTLAAWCLATAGRQRKATVPGEK